MEKIAEYRHIIQKVLTEYAAPPSTDLDIAEKLEEHGVPKSDIVLAFQAPTLRQYSGYATA